MHGGLGSLRCGASPWSTRELRSSRVSEVSEAFVGAPRELGHRALGAQACLSPGTAGLGVQQRGRRTSWTSQTTPLFPTPCLAGGWVCRPAPTLAQSPQVGQLQGARAGDSLLSCVSWTGGTRVAADHLTRGTSSGLTQGFQGRAALGCFNRTLRPRPRSPGRLCRRARVCGRPAPPRTRLPGDQGVASSSHPSRGWALLPHSLWPPGGLCGLSQRARGQRGAVQEPSR